MEESSNGSSSSDTEPKVTVPVNSVIVLEDIIAAGGEVVYEMDCSVIY